MKKSSVSHHFHFLHWNMNIVEFYTFQTIFRTAFGMINLFLPIYLISDIGYSFAEVLLFYVILQIGFVLFVPFSSKIIEKIGLKHTIASQIPFLIIFWISLRFLTGNFVHDLLIFVPILLVRAFFRSSANVAVDTFLAKNVLRKNSGSMLGWLQIAMAGATIISPLLGGLVSYFYGFDTLFWIGIGLQLVSAIPLFLTPDEYFKLDCKPTQIVDFVEHKIDKNYLAAEAGNVLSDTAMWILWPLFLYFAMENTADLGALMTASAAVSMLVAYFVGKRVDRGKPEKMLRQGVKISSGMFLLRAISLEPVFIGIIDAANKVLEPVFRIPYNNIAYHVVMQDKNTVKLAIVKQWIAEIFYTAGMILLFVLALFLPTEGDGMEKIFMLLFAIFAGIMLLMQLMTRVKVRGEVQHPELLKSKKKRTQKVSPAKA